MTLFFVESAEIIKWLRWVRERERERKGRGEVEVEKTGEKRSVQSEGEGV